MVFQIVSYILLMNDIYCSVPYVLLSRHVFVALKIYAPYFFRIQCNVTFTSTPWSSKLSLTFFL